MKSIRSRDHALVKLTVDLVILTVREAMLQVLLVKRGNPPFAGEFALPGGFMREGEPLISAAWRELAEETNMDPSQLHLEQLSTYADPDRDPRGRIVTVAFLAIAPDLPTPVAGTDATEAGWQPVEALLNAGGPTSFDHHQILIEGLERAKEKLEYTTLATAFCPQTFTIADLRRVYELVWGVALDPGNFSRKVTNTDGFVEATGLKRTAEAGRPAALYRAGRALALHPPMLRSPA
jgi:8-oxo-dGTP diphosphatase